MSALYGPPQRPNVALVHRHISHLPDRAQRARISLAWRLAKAGLSQDVLEAVVLDSLAMPVANLYAYYSLGGDRLGRIVGLCAERRAEVEKAEREDQPATLFSEEALGRFRLK